MYGCRLFPYIWPSVTQAAAKDLKWSDGRCQEHLDSSICNMYGTHNASLAKPGKCQLKDTGTRNSHATVISTLRIYVPT